LILQDLNKYGTPRYRLVVRISNKNVLCQVTYATMTGDRVVCQAGSQELKQFGLTTGFTSYAAAYCAGLMVARRLLTKFGMDKMFVGVKEADGKDYDVSADKEAVQQSRRPFKACLDLGLTRSTIGNRVYGAMKGACDGGLHVPHSVKKFPGFEKEEGQKKGQYNAEVHMDRIYGCHVDEYMDKLKEKSEDDYNKQFGKWDKCLKANKVETVEDLFKSLHQKVRANPVYKPTKKNAEKVQWVDKEKTVIKTSKGTYKRDRKLTYDQRKTRVQEKMKFAFGEE